jgi:hypothetical protein
MMLQSKYELSKSYQRERMMSINFYQLFPDRYGHACQIEEGTSQVAGVVKTFAYMIFYKSPG